MSDKKYFAKYLPVEGDIKSGDRYKVKDVDTLFTASKDVSKNLWLNGEVYKVKLFLCSRDIQVGDKVFSAAMHRANQKVPDASVDPWIIISDEEERKLFKSANSIKAIGEISPEATWVKDGDEFEEKDLKPMFYKGSHAGISGTFSRLKELSTIADNKELRVRIKGPCGHFH